MISFKYQAAINNFQANGRYEKKHQHHDHAAIRNETNINADASKASNKNNKSMAENANTNGILALFPRHIFCSPLFSDRSL